MRTSEVAAQAHVNTQTLRYYERRGLLPAPKRTSSGYRAYTAASVRVVRFVKRAQQLGFTLSDIEELLHLACGGPASCEDAKTMAKARIADLQQRIAERSACAMRWPGWSTPVINPAPSGTAPSFATSKQPRDAVVCGDGVTGMRIELLTSPGCPNAAAKDVITKTLTALGIDAAIIDRVGPYPSPTVLIDGVDLMRPESAPVGHACRLDLPTPQRVFDALVRASRSSGQQPIGVEEM